MSFEEKTTWVTALSQLVVALWYLARILSKAATTPVAAIGYRGDLLVMIVVSVALTVAGVVAVAVVAAARAEISGEPADVDRKDERDRSIARFAGNIGGTVLAAGVVPAMLLAVFEFDHFWIAHALLAAIVVSELVTAGVKVAAYRRGF
jgi:hypothetical protein